MTATDPRHLIPRLEDLSERIQRAAAEARDLMAQSVWLQAQMREQANHVNDRAIIAASTAADDLRRAESCGSAVGVTHARWESTSQTTHAVAKNAATCRANADAARAKWENEVHLAIYRVQNAVAAVDAAEHAVDSARSHLQAAKAALASCRTPVPRTDSQGRTYYVQRDCSNYEAAVVAAMEHLEEARMRLHVAEAELAAAKAHLTACKHALELAVFAVGIATSADSDATWAVREVSEAATRVDAARSQAHVACEHATAEVAAAETALQHAVQADKLVSAAAQILQQAQGHGDSAGDATVLGDRHLLELIERLREFDRPKPLA